MTMKRIILFPILFISIFAFSQNIRLSPNLKGTVTDSKTSEVLPFVNVVLFQNGEMVMGTQTDFDGNYSFKAVKEGEYELRLACLGYTVKKIQGITISKDETKFINLRMDDNPQDIVCFTICCFCSRPLIDTPPDLIAEQDSINKKEDKLLPSTGFSANYISEDFKVYPVPCRGIVTLENLPKTNKMLLIDINGKVLETIYIHDDAKMTIDLTRFQRGIYFLKYTEFAQQKTKRLMKQ